MSEAAAWQARRLRYGDTMKIAVAGDHAGVPLNEQVIAELRRLGHEVVDLGTHDANKPDDYPDYAAALAKDLVRAFVGAKFTGEERHRRRLDKV